MILVIPITYLFQTADKITTCASTFLTKTQVSHVTFITSHSQWSTSLGAPCVQSPLPPVHQKRSLPTSKPAGDIGPGTVILANTFDQDWLQLISSAQLHEQLVVADSVASTAAICAHFKDQQTDRYQKKWTAGQFRVTMTMTVKNLNFPFWQINVCMALHTY